MDGINSLNSFLAVHKPQLLLSGVPEYFWPALCKKFRDQIFDSGIKFQLVQIDYEGTDRKPYDPLWSVIAIEDVDKADPSNIFLIDHAWTFKPSSIKSNLRNVPALLDRMCNLLQISEGTTEEKIELVAQNIWPYANTYAIGGTEFSVEERVPVWYVLDELGSAITHSEKPNFRAVPIMYVPEQTTYTIIFPIENVEEGETITKNFIEGYYPDRHQREAMLIPWKHYDNFYDDFSQDEPDNNYFIEGHIVETLPKLELLQQKSTLSCKLKVFSEYSYINQYLTSPNFEIVDNEDEADVLWFMNHFTTYEELSTVAPHKFVNQFPFEYVITVKDLLAVIARRTTKGQKEHDLDTLPPWLPTTFNLKTELSKLASCYMQRKRAGLDNHWICKPFNLARGLDTYITDSLNFLCRLPHSGPKIAQKYIENPVLINRPEIGPVKFDIRYVILLKSVSPTKVFVYNNFFLRFSNKEFALNNFDDYEQHFTVMNYAEGVSLHRMLCEEFKAVWTKQYPHFDWCDMEKSILSMISELFTGATSKPPPVGIAKSPQSRALYAADIMLSWNNTRTCIQPKLLEVNWMPDCRRACEYYPQFYNDIFSLLFLNKEVSTCTKVL